VVAGQVLARLDTWDLENAVSQAQVSLQISELQLQKTKKGVEPKDEEVAAAQAAIASAKAALEDLLSRPTERDRKLAELNLSQAKNNLWSAQAQRDSTAGTRGVSRAAVDAAEAAVAQAEIALQIAEIQYEQSLEGPSEKEILAARAQLEQAKANLARLYNEPTEEDLELARLQVEQARLALESAQRRLDEAVITAPIEGKVVAVNIQVGDQVTPGAPAIELVDLSRFHIEVLIDETDISKIAIGQKAKLTLDAFPSEEIIGEVSKISTTGTQSEGLIVYTVTIDLGKPDLPIKPDMTASVEIITAHKNNALLIPNRAIRRDKKGKYVEILDGTTLKRVDITTGLIGDTHTEVLSGLQEGDQVVVQKPQQSIFQRGGK